MRDTAGEVETSSWTSKGRTTCSNVQTYIQQLSADIDSLYIYIYIYKLNEPNMRDTAGEVGTSSWTSKGWMTCSNLQTYIQQLSADRGCSPVDLLEAMDDREGWRGRVRNIRADRAT